MWYLCKRTIVFWYLRCNLDGIMKNQELHFIIILKGSKKLFKFYNFCIDLVKSKIDDRIKVSWNKHAIEIPNFSSIHIVGKNISWRIGLVHLQ